MATGTWLLDLERLLDLDSGVGSRFQKGTYGGSSCDTLKSGAGANSSSAGAGGNPWSTIQWATKLSEDFLNTRNTCKAWAPPALVSAFTKRDGPACI